MGDRIGSVSRLTSQSIEFVIFACLGFFGITGNAPAAGAENGWGVQFYHDAFTDRTFPIAIISETTDGGAFDKASLQLVCAENDVRVGFQPRRLVFDQSVSGQFRTADGIIEINFAPVEIEGLGRHRAANRESSEKLIAALSSARAPFPYQSGDKKGTFPIIGFRQVLEIMNANCRG